MGWTAENIAYLRRWWKNGKTAAEIAEHVGTSRSAVCGKADRLSKADARSYIAPRRVRPTPAVQTAAKENAKAARRATSRAAQTRHAMKRDGVTGGTGGITPGFQAPAPRACQWLHGEPTDRNFCGAPARPGSSYCDEHHARCYTAPELRQRAKSLTRQKSGRLSLAIPT